MERISHSEFLSHGSLTDTPGGLTAGDGAR
jgi:hypothetical protein